MTLEKLLEFAAEQAVGIFSIQGAIQPMVHAIDDKGDHLVIATPGICGNDDEKDITAEALRAFFKKKNIKQFVMMMEAWKLDLRELPSDGIIPRPMYSKDRYEVVTLVAADCTGEMQGNMDIIRPPNERPSLGKLETYRPEHAEGRFVGLLPTETRVQ